MNNVLQQNADWWSHTDKNDGYTVDFIKEDNSTYDFALLQKINRKVFTIDSQEQAVIVKEESIDEHSISFFCDVWNYKRDQLIDARIILDIQRPYLELLASIEIGNKLFDRFKNDRYVGLTYFNNKCFQYNNTILNMLNNDSKKFQTKNKVILTYYELNNYVTNNDNITIKWLTPTTFKYNHHWQNIHYTVNSSLCHLDGSEHLDTVNFCILFFVGKNPTIDMNHILHKINVILNNPFNQNS